MSSRSFRCFGIVPAAGISKRMGENKLLLPYEGKTLLEHVLSQWSKSRVDRTVVVLRSKDNAMLHCCQLTGADYVITNTAPREMKHSIQEALGWLEKNVSPNPEDAWLLAPADVPRLSYAVIDRVIESYDPKSAAIVVPRYGRHRGHPAMFPWTLSSTVFGLNDQQGVNSLLDRFTVLDVPVDDIGILQDVDTPDDFQQLRGNWRGNKKTNRRL